MKTGFSGTFVISWTQTEIDGLADAPQTALTVGAQWAWRGDALRVDGPNDVLKLGHADGTEAVRRRAARMVQKLVGQALDPKPDPVWNVSDEDPTTGSKDRSFVVTDGGQSYAVTLIDSGPTTPALLMFVGQAPPRNTDLWVVHHALGAQGRTVDRSTDAGMICFTPGTRIQTPGGHRLIENLEPGDVVQTKDNGPQAIRWIGSRYMTGARLFAMPRLRPIRFRVGALGIDRPEEELIVSPDHRMLIRSHAARDLFHTPEVLVAARELVNWKTVSVDLTAQSVTYIHLLFDQHQVIMANGTETESYNPSQTSLDTLTDADRARLLEFRPDLDHDPQNYGPSARRNLSLPEAALLRHAA